MPEKMTENGQKVENVHNGDGATSHNTHDTSSSQDAPSTNMARIKELMSTHGMNFEDAKEIAEMEASTNTVEKQEAAPVVAQPAPTEAPAPAVIEEEAIDDTFTIKLEQRHVEPPARLEAVLPGFGHLAVQFHAELLVVDPPPAVFPDRRSPGDKKHGAQHRPVAQKARS